MDKSTIEALKKDLRKYEEKVNAIKILLNLPSEDSNKSNSDEASRSHKNNDQYYEEKTLKGKVIYFFNKHKRFLHCREIADMMVEQEPNLKIKTSRVSQIVSNLKKDEDIKLTRITVGSQLRNTFWGSENWLEENGDPKPKHMYNQDYVHKEETEIIKL